MDIEQLEALALSDDRSTALAQLIPGTEDYYFHHCLAHQHGGEADEVRALLQAWVKRHGETARVREIRDRQALLELERDGATAREYLRRRFSLTFDHQREVEGAPSELPTRVDPAWIGRAEFARHALAHHENLDGFTDRALDWVAEDASMSLTRLRALLSRLRRPDVPKLAELVLRELEDRHSSGFGSLAIHSLLTVEQLDALAVARPALLQDPQFVTVRLARMQPEPGTDLDADPERMQAWLDELWAFVEPLHAAFNSLVLHVLHHRLDLDRRRGIYDRARFDRYIRVPRQASYVAESYRRTHERALAQFGQSFESATTLATVHDDTELVRDFLAQVFADPTIDDYADYKPYIDERFLRRLFAETKILAGTGDKERWYSLLDDPSYYAALEQRVEIQFRPDNPRYVAVDEPVELRVDVKNVPTLIVKVFEINTLAYFQLHGGAVDTGVDLDGLVAEDEQVIEYAEPPLHRVRRTLRFESLTRPGTYVIELIGGGRSSRALIRKGALRYVERRGAAGHVLTILDEHDAVVPDASVWFGGREYKADASGEIRVPYAGSARSTKILLRHGEVSTIATLLLAAESYVFVAGVHVEREQLIAGRTADVIVRASLSVSGVPISPSLLREPTLTITSTDRHNTSSSVTVPLELDAAIEAEAVHAFKVPEALQQLAFEVRAKVRSIAEQREVELSRSSAIRINEIDATNQVVGLHLGATQAGYVVYALGKSGEPRAGLQVNLSFAHIDFRARMQVATQTDARGRIELGALDDILRVAASIAGGGRAEWALPRGGATLPRTLHLAAGDELVLPRVGELGIRSLLERRGGGYLRDCRDQIEDAGEGALRIRGLDPGDYELVLDHERRAINLRVGGSTIVAGWALAPRRQLQLHAPEPLHVAAIDLDAATITVRVGGADEHTRVHVLARRFVPHADARTKLDVISLPDPGVADVRRSRSRYLSGRDIGDEYRYILERRRAEVFAGSMLERPGLLLNPWAVRSTSTGVQEARGGESYAKMAEEEAAMRMAPGAPPAQARAQAAPSDNVDFLAAPAWVGINLEVDAEGVITIDRAELAGHQLVTVVAVNALGAVSRHLALPEVEAAARDLRLRDALDPDRHFVKRKQRASLAAGEELILDDLRTAKLEAVDSVAKAHALLLTLSGDAHLREFEFVTRWPSLTPDEQREKYSKYACHELNLFLSRKDPEFFAEVVRPYLAHKRDKTFVDRYLLDEDLSEFCESWAYAQLNTLERILLAERVAGEAGPGSRHVGDRFDLLPPDVEADNAAFDTALQGSALDAEADDYGAGSIMPPSAGAVPGGAAFGGRGAMAIASGGPPPAAAPAPPPQARPAAAMPPPAPRSPARKRARRREQQTRSGVIDTHNLDRDLAAREDVRRFYRAADKTKEWAENNYYRRTIADHGPELIRVNAFWRDYAEHVGAGLLGKRPFVSGQFVRATGCFAEMACALALLDLPFSAEPAERSLDGARLSLRPSTPLVAFHEQIVAVEQRERHAGVLVSQNYFRADDRHRYEGNEVHDKYVEGELLVHTVYVCQVVLTNPSSTAHKLELLLQIPRGAMPVEAGFVTRDVHVHLPPHGTHALEYAFYFPTPGRFAHFPVHVAKHGELTCFAEARALEVVERLSSVDTSSWSHVSQHGSDAELLAYLDAHNLERLDLGRIAWRMREPRVFAAILDRLRARHVYDRALWSYAIDHGDAQAIGEFLRHEDGFLRGCGLAIDSPLVRTDPVARRWYQHLEYAPLINARAHQLGERRKILNDALASQYRSFLTALTYAPRPSDDHLVAAAYYALLQDRVSDGLALLERVDPGRVTGQLQYDYLCAYAALFRGQLDAARELGERWREHPVDRWRKRFVALCSVLDEAEGATAQVVDADSREQEQAALAASEVGLDFEVEGSALTITHQNLRACTLCCYRMDIELLFSRQPFMKDQSGRFAIVSPNHREDIELPEDRGEHRVELPAAYRSQNAILELRGGGLRRTRANYAHELAVRVIEQYGQLRVHAREADRTRPLPRAYVKVYARKHGGEVGFYKDGYTDVRGAFDYASLSTDELDRVERFAILVMSDDHGALIREADPPQR